MQVKIEASENVNPDETGRSLPTQVQVLQLAALDKLEGATFDDIWLRQDETLKDEVVGTYTETVYPGRIAEVKALGLEAKARFVVVIATFHQPSGTTWRATYELPANEKEVCRAEDKGLNLKFVLHDRQVEGGEDDSSRGGNGAKS